MKGHIQLLRRIIVSISIFVIVAIAIYLLGKRSSDGESQRKFSHTVIRIGEEMIELPLPGQAKVVGIGMFAAGSCLLVDYHVAGEGPMRHKVALTPEQRRRFHPGVQIVCADVAGRRNFVIKLLEAEVRLHQQRNAALDRQKKLLREINEEERERLLLMQKERAMIEKTPWRNEPAPLVHRVGRDGEKLRSPFRLSPLRNAAVLDEWTVCYSCSHHPPPFHTYSEEQKRRLEEHARFLNRLGLHCTYQYNDNTKPATYRLTWRLMEPRCTRPMNRMSAMRLAERMRWFRIVAQIRRVK